MPGCPSRIVSLVAAYALALQALLSAFLPLAALAADDTRPFALLCSGSAASSDGERAPALPAQPHDCSGCIMSGCAGGLAPPVQGAVASMPDRSRQVALPDPFRGGGLVPFRTPHIPRGPPVA